MPTVSTGHIKAKKHSDLLCLGVKYNWKSQFDVVFSESH